MKACEQKCSLTTWVNSPVIKSIASGRPPRPAFNHEHFKFVVSLPAWEAVTCLSPVTSEKVRKLIESAPMKTWLTDTTPTSLLKDVSGELSVMIQRVANVSFLVVRFPLSMKLGQITPLHNTPSLDAGYFKNFRPATNSMTISNHRRTCTSLPASTSRQTTTVFSQPTVQAVQRSLLS